MQANLAAPTVRTRSSAASIDNDVKMIIWDLDDTFWTGTLAEESIEFVASNAEIVRALASRGILSSIASKNDLDAAKKILEREGIWDYFVFPSISFNPKGERVAEIIRNASLRTENILFIDDNVSNLEEARFYSPGIMLAQPGEIIPRLLDHPRLAGKADPDLKRLKQYQLLQRKFIDQSSTTLSNEDFLRSSKIEIRFDFDVESNFDRIVDLINRANQLNYTKRRLRSKEDVDQFRSSLNGYGTAAGCVSCSDRYGDYGIVGFFMLKRNDKGSELLHFVFSCRTMNMGIEQFVYSYLGTPKLAVVPEVAYRLDNEKKIDWISIVNEAAGNSSLVGIERMLVLIGGCELQQLASFCSSNRVEFVNKISTRDGADYIIRYDDPSFFTTDRETIRRNRTMQGLVAWTYEDALLLDKNIARADIIIVAMRAALRHSYIVTKEDNIRIRTEGRNIEHYLARNPEWFNRNVSVLNIPMRDRLAQIQEALGTVGRHSRADAVVFLLGGNIRKVIDVVELTASVVYNKFCEKFCQEHEDKFHFVDVNKIVPDNAVLDSFDHFSRIGYHALSVHIMSRLSAEQSA
jgi:FkbH-like protein